MKYDIDSIKDRYRKRYGNSETFNFVFFGSESSPVKGTITSSCLSQWWVAPFSVDGKTYPTAEHWMMFQKAMIFGDMGIAEEVIKIVSPADIKALGRKIKGFDEKIWNERKFEIVLQGNYHKFSQNEPLLNFLLNTDTAIPAEVDLADKIWGIGLSAGDADIKNPCLWKGTNLLGFALMEVRDLLKDKL